MSDRLLATIIELEKALQEETRREAERAAAWRDRELAALALEASADRQKLSGAEAKELSAARQEVEAEGTRLLAAAEARCTRMTALSDAVLEEVLRRQLHRLLPEDGDDHPHGQG